MKDNSQEETYSDFIEDFIGDGSNVIQEDDDDVKIAYFPSGSDDSSASGGASGRTRQIGEVSSDEGGFLRSVINFSSKDIRTKKKKKTLRHIGVIGVMRILAFCMCVGVFAWSVMQIVQSQIDSKAAAKTYQSLTDKMNGQSGGENGDDENESKIDLTGNVKLSELIGLDTQDLQSGSEIKEITYDHIAELIGIELADEYRALARHVSELRELNPDTLAWIRVAGTRINYPVMLRNSDTANNYYLHHDFEHTEKKEGSIFADYKVNLDYESNRNVVIYGHCMTNGSMFRSIKLLFDDKDRQALSKQWEIEIIMPECIYIYKIFSGYRSEGNRFIQYINKNTISDEDFRRFLTELKINSVFKNDLTYNGTSKLVTLSTCTNVKGKPDERYVLHCILTSKITLD